jgi:putative ABC transport system permease protein
VVVAFAAISVVNTLVMTTAERGREFALLRLVGATRRQVLRSVYWEAALISVFGVLLGSVIAGSSLAPISRGLTGSSVPYLPLAQYLPVVAAAVALVFVAAMLPARAALARSADMVASTQHLTASSRLANVLS